MSDFEKEDMQVMDVVNGHASPEASARAERLVKAWWQLDASRIKAALVQETSGMSQEKRNRILCRLKALWRLIVIELLGYAALGGVLVAGMAMGVVPMGAAVPVFVACFMWVAVRLDRWLRR